MRYVFLAASFLAGMLTSVGAGAHHSFAMFDRSKEVTLVGTVKDFQWTNPHCWLQLAVSSNGDTHEWSLEGGSPGILGRNGWKRTSLQPGDKVTVTIYPLGSGEPGGSFIQVNKADGSVLYYHG
jgi:Family of unknown function (DUF6152)